MTPPDEPRERVAIAVVEHAGQYLVGTRRAEQALAGRAEFPGGRCLPGEAGSACAARECREETGLEVTPLRLLATIRHDYSHAALDLEFWLCRLAGNQDAQRVTGGFRWVAAESLNSLDFPEANAGVLAILSAGRQSAS